MNMIKMLAVAATMIVVWWAVASAEPSHTAIGSGNASCGTWTEDRRYNDPIAASQEAQWALGFLSGIAANPDWDPLAHTDAAGVVEWISNYCATHPLNTISSAAMVFAITMKEHGGLWQ